MKKFILGFITVCLSICTFAFVGCGSASTTKQEIQINKDIFLDYFYIQTSVKDIQWIEDGVTSDIFHSTKYSGSLTLLITVGLKKEAKISDVNVTFNIPTSQSGWYTSYENRKTTIYLSLEGKGEVFISFSREAQANQSIPNFEVEIANAQGKIYVSEPIQEQQDNNETGLDL